VGGDQLSAWLVDYGERAVTTAVGNTSYSPAPPVGTSSVDVIVYAPGVHATDYLFPMTIIGRDGATIEKTWAEDGARAYHEVVGYALECMEHRIEVNVL
jgi:hypothetical protein